MKEQFKSKDQYNAYMRKYYRLNKERIQAYRRDWNRKDREKKRLRLEELNKPEE